ncbi:hypothetical protein ABU178_05220 [Pantoea osteomyelitidis]|uniref:Uncharacterized protein n=1 Tax=Pantoea osteomyelitidis TaxID=3230026 RepID=A0ABW7PTG0_9GAMM
MKHPEKKSSLSHNNNDGYTEAATAEHASLKTQIDLLLEKLETVQELNDD